MNENWFRITAMIIVGGVAKRLFSPPRPVICNGPVQTPDAVKDNA